MGSGRKYQLAQLRGESPFIHIGKEIPISRHAGSVDTYAVAGVTELS